MAWTIASILAASRPSEKFGTHSTSCLIKPRPPSHHSQELSEATHRQPGYPFRPCQTPPHHAASLAAALGWMVSLRESLSPSISSAQMLIAISGTEFRFTWYVEPFSNARTL